MTVTGFARLLWSLAPRTLVRLAALTLLVAMAEIAGGLLLAPLLAILGSSGEGGVGEGQSSRLVWLLGRLGIPTNFDGLLIAYVLVVLLYSFASTQLANHQVRMGQDLVSRFRARLLGALMRADWSAVVSLRAAEITHAATVAQTHVTYAAQQFGGLLGALGVILLYAVACLVLAPGLTMLALGFGLLPLLLARRRRRLVALNRAAHDASTHYQAILHDALQGLRHVRTHGFEADTLALLANADRESMSRHRVSLDAAATSRARQLFVGALALAGVLELAVRRFATPALDMLVLVFIFLRLWPRLGQLQRALVQLGPNLPFVDRVHMLIARLEACGQPVKPFLGVNPPRRDIVLRGVSFAYRGNRTTVKDPNGVAIPMRWILRNLTLALPVGCVTALMGPSGAGKSTCTDLFTGLLTPDEGWLEIDGQALDTAHRSGWRAQILSITADSLLLHASVRDNLCLGLHPVPPNATLWQALDRAGAHFVREYPQGLDTLVGERAGRLSGGQRQRLALARAWLRPISLLILDEATSALDAESEAGIYASLRAHPPAPTILVVSHRDSVRDFADQLVDMPAPTYGE